MIDFMNDETISSVYQFETLTVLSKKSATSMWDTDTKAYVWEKNNFFNKEFLEKKTR